MKTLDEIYTEVVGNEALQQKFAALKTPEEVCAFVKELGCEASIEEITAFLQAKDSKEGELNDEDLLQVAGGKSTTSKCNIALSVCTLGVGCAVRTIISTARGAGPSSYEPDDEYLNRLCNG